MFQTRIKSEIHKGKLVNRKLNSSKSIPGLGEYNLDIIEGKDFAVVNIVKNVIFLMQRYSSWSKGLD